MASNTLAAALVLLLLLTGSTRAVELAGAVGDYSVESWDERQGLPPGRIWAITQDAIGYLWLGTEAGLVRFDGVRFVPWTESDGTPLPPDSGVSSLLAASDGSFWVGFYSSGIGRIRNGRLERFGRAQGISDGRILFIVEDPAGTVWAGHAESLYRFQAGRWERADGRFGLPGGGAFDAYEDRAGALWIAMNNGVFRRPAGGAAFERVDDASAMIRFSEDRAGTMWMTDLQAGFARLAAPSGGPSSPRPGFGHVLIHDRNDMMWVGTRGQGLWRVRHDSGSSEPTVQQITVADGLSSDIVRSVFEDRDGNVWVGTESGLHRFTERKTTPLTDIGFSWATQTTPDGNAWIGTTDGLVQLDGQTRRRYGPDEGLPSAFVRALFTDADGTLWVATDRGVARRQGDRFEPVLTTVSLPRVISLAVDARGQIWLAERELGTFVWSDGHLQPVASPTAVAGANANFVYVDRRERLWIGYQGATVIVRERNGETRAHALGDAIGTVLTAVYEDRQGAIWLGGTRGLGRIADGRLDFVAQPTDLPGYGVFAITEDDDGHLWLGISSGILSLDPADFEHASNRPGSSLNYRFFDASDGLVGVPARLGFPGATRREDGALLFITSRGVSMIRPSQMEAGERTTPTLRIESVRADDRLVPTAPGAALPPGTSRLLFEYTALNLTSPLRERFQYRLEGVDADWVVAGSRREAFYANLDSGTYRFQVASVNDDRAASEAVAEWRFSIQPMYYETWWFILACTGAVGLAGWGAWQLRLRQLRRQFALVFAERARMSREIHDTLLQDLVGVSLHFDEFAASAGDTLGPAAGQVVRLRRYLERAVAEARHAVWDLRSAHNEDADLPTALRECGERAFQDKTAQFTITIGGTPRPYPPAIERHLLRIAREAIGNAARHAEATHVHLSLDYGLTQVVLRVSDDGRGCRADESSAELPGHYGFLIMRERAEQAGGRFQVDSRPGQGTRIEVTIPTPPPA